MSYILEALRKSEMECRGGILAATPAPTFVAASGGTQGSGLTAAVAAACLLAGLGLGLGGSGWSRGASAGVAAETAPRPDPVRSAGASPPSPPPASSKPEAGFPGAAAAAAGAGEPAPVLRAGAAPGPRAPGGKPSRGRSAAAAEKAGTAAAAGRAAPGDGVLAFGELPAALRAGLPRIAFGGYAGEDEGARIALINHRLVKEGEEVSPGVTLERVEREGVILGCRGYRFRPAP